MECIDTSIFELFKIGPGPSSSHTIGPMKAGFDFLQRMIRLPAGQKAKARRVLVRLFGSLSATGKGHGTDRAVLAGLLGEAPETCPSPFLDGLLRGADAVYALPEGAPAVSMSAKDIVFDRIEHEFPFPNTLVITLEGADETLLEQEYYSVGGGFLQWKGWEPSQRGAPVHPYATMRELRAQLEAKGLTLPALVLANEMAITGASEEQVNAGLDSILQAMEASVANGLVATGPLPGTLGLYRKARTILEHGETKRFPEERFLTLLAACAFAAAEENAAGHTIVTAPTCGSAGVIPAVAHVMREHLESTPQQLREGLMAAAAVGFLAKRNATIAGAEGGCQAEIGVASAMAAAMLTQGTGYEPNLVENAAETALEHHLGMTCDPVGGFVQIPCIERNAMSAVKAYTAFLIAADEAPAMHKVGLDEVIQAMRETGRDMSTKYKETSLGGLAVSLSTC